jgi:hypothetical protein
MTVSPHELTGLAAAVFPNVQVVDAVPRHGGLEASVTRLTLRDSGRADERLRKS